MSPQSMFTALDDSNTAVLTLSDPRANHFHTRKVCTLADTRCIANAILRYARERRIDPRAVEYAVAWPAGKAPRANPTSQVINMVTR